MISLFKDKKKEETKGTPVWVFALGVAGMLGAVGAAYYFWPF